MFDFFRNFPVPIELNAETIVRIEGIFGIDVQPDIDFVSWFSQSEFIRRKMSAALHASMGTKPSRFVDVLVDNGYRLELDQYDEKPIPDTDTRAIEPRVRHYPIVVCDRFRLAA